MLVEAWCNGTLLGHIPTTSGGVIHWSLWAAIGSLAALFSPLPQRVQGWLPLYQKRRREKKKAFRTNSATLFLNMLLAED